MEVKDKVKQRRLERLRHLREAADNSSLNGSPARATRSLDQAAPPRQQPELPLYVDSDWKRRLELEDPEYAWKQKVRMDKTLGGDAYDPDGERGLFAPPSPRKIAMKLLVSCMLFAALYGMFQLNEPWANKGKQFVAASLTESYNFTAFSNWYENRFGGAPSFIPSFNREGDEAVRVSTSKRTMYAPVKGTVMKPFDGTNQLGVNLNTQDYAPVYALDTGQVIFSGVAADTGLTVIIRHPGGLQSLYGGLGEASVEAGDWMKVGEPIGKASKKDPVKGTLYVAFTRDGRPVNPTDVISFD
ncbi:peptidoglycan DD-metalloendopeptidase family protein [Paenibacillus sp. GCM10023248]|uniref:M23 family metallopeptidase n=1 Tax=Bacillales TaxID=1385 RepID=UPI00237944C4|nr:MULTISPECIES: M23 family metallopeptidase [Bacillales]MDD9269858.1 M23 family metallopeptidase [Paenibacillus sp. MAHUQ-63]MDR6884956.1 stage IV sporulation protein FA [Bacillus sp. 3255]